MISLFQTAILNANYMAARLSSHYSILFKGNQGITNESYCSNCTLHVNTSSVPPM